MGERRICFECNKEVEVVKVIPQKVYDEQVFSCGHTGKLIKRSIEETVSITDKLIASKTIKIEPLENTPVLVSGKGFTEHGILPTIHIEYLNGNFIIDRNSFSNIFSHYESIDNSINIDLHDIFVDIDKSDNSPQQKDQIKEILNILNKDIGSKPLTQILASFPPKLKTFFPLVTPFIIPFLTKFLNPS